MSRKLLLKRGEDINNLALRLQRSNKVNAFDNGDYKESGTLAHCFSDLESSFSTFLDILLPKLMIENITPEEIEDTLFDIGQELNHILYHIKTAKYFKDYIYFEDKDEQKQ